MASASCLNGRRAAFPARATCLATLLLFLALHPSTASQQYFDPDSCAQQYTVRGSESCALVASSFGLTLGELLRLNTDSATNAHYDCTALASGDQLCLRMKDPPPPGTAALPTARRQAVPSPPPLAPRAPRDPPRPPAPPAPPSQLPLPAWSHSCSIHLQGNPDSADSPAAVSINCWAFSGNLKERRFNCSSGDHDAGLTAWVGRDLFDHIAGNQPPVCGVKLQLRSAGTLDGAALGAEDWGITFQSVPHLRLVDSLVADLPLSPVGPLVQCRGCGHLTVENVRVERLRGRPVLAALPDPTHGAGVATAAASSPQRRPDYGIYGPLHASGLVGAHLTGFECTSVEQSHGWSCVLLQYKQHPSGSKDSSSSGAIPWKPGPGAPSKTFNGTFLTIMGSTFTDNAVVWRAPTNQSLGGVEQLEGGGGAIVVDADVKAAGEDGAPAGGLHALDVLDAMRWSAEGNAGGWGAALTVLGVHLGHLSIGDGSLLSENRATLGSGGAVAVMSSMESLSLDNSTVTDNVAVQHGGAVYLGATSSSSSSSGSTAVETTITITGGSRVAANRADLDGGAFYFAGPLLASLQLAGASTLEGNAAKASGGAVYTHGSIGSVQVAGGSSWRDNMAQGSGGAVYCRGSVASLRAGQASAISGNTAGMQLPLASDQRNITHSPTLFDASGGAIWVGGSVGLIQVNGGVRIRDNYADLDGGFLRAAYIKQLQLSQATVAGNTARRGRGGVIANSGYPYATAADGMAALPLCDPSTQGYRHHYNWTIGPQSVWKNNSAGASGGAVMAAFGLACLDALGRAGLGTQARHASLDLRVSNSSFDGNVATGSGGALAVVNPFDPTMAPARLDQQALKVSLESSTVVGNVAGGKQGAGAEETAEGAHGSARGGGVYVAVPQSATQPVSSCSVSILGTSNFMSNAASTVGGALAFVGCGSAIKDAYFAGNQAGTDGGALAVLDSSVDQECAGPGCTGSTPTASVSGSTFEGNMAGGSGGALHLRLEAAAVQPRTTQLLDMASCTLERNTAGSGGGLGVAASAPFRLALSKTRLKGNVALGYGGGALHVQSGSGSDVTLANSQLVGNTAAAGGGGGVLLQAGSSLVSAGADGDAGAAANAAFAGVIWENNTAVAGGAMQLGAGTAAALTACTLKGNSAASGPGGGILADGCLRLSLKGCSVVRNAATAGAGGGLSSGGCGQVLLLDSTLTDNAAVSGGAVYLSAPAAGRAHGRAAGTPDGANSTSVAVVWNSRFEGNTAATEPGAAAVAMPRPGRGGAVYVSDRVSVALGGKSSFGPGNDAQYGWCLASDQVCPGPAGSSFVAAGGSAEAVLAQLNATARPGCSVLALLPETRLAGQVARTAEDATEATAGAALWLEDPSYSALVVNCSGVSKQQQAPAAAAASSNAKRRSLLASPSGQPAAAAAATDAALAKAGSQRQLKLRDALAYCMAPVSSSVEGGAAASVALSVLPKRLGGLTATALGTQEQQEAGVGLGVRLVPGELYDISVRLYDAFGTPIDADSLDIRVTVSVHGVPGSTASAHPDAANAAMAVLLNLGADGSRRVSSGIATWHGVSVVGWPGAYRLAFRATAKAAHVAQQALEYTADLQLLPCGVGMALAPAPLAAGSFINHTWLTTCEPCLPDHVGFWRDSRSALLALPGLNATSSRQHIAQATATVDVELLRHSGRGSAACRACPAHASCPGGATVVPWPGYWHSAANSTRVHRCPYPQACTRASSPSQVYPLNPWQLDTRVEAYSAPLGTLPVGVTVSSMADPRSRLLAACQGAWYASSTHPGAWVMAEAARLGLLPGTSYSSSSNGDESGASFGAWACLLWHDASLLPPAQPSEAFAPASTAGVADGSFGGGAAWEGAPSDGPSGAQLSYTELQCAPGYTGNLCAACEPGHYSTPSFTCEPCPSPAGAFARGFFSMVAGVLVVLGVVTANLWVSYAVSDEAEDNGKGAVVDLIKGLVIYLQYLVIVMRLGLPHPPVLRGVAALSGWLLASGDTAGPATACLRRGVGPGGQATGQLLGGLLLPGLVAAASVGLWALRHRYLTTSRPDGASRERDRDRRRVSLELPPASTSHALASPSGTGAADPHHPWADPTVSASATTADESTPLMAEGGGPQFSIRSTPGRRGHFSTGPFSRADGGSLATNSLLTSEAQDGGQDTRLQPPAAAVTDTETAAELDELRSKPKRRVYRAGAPGPWDAFVSAVSAKAHWAWLVAREAFLQRFPHEALTHTDRKLPLGHQLGLVLLVAVFIMYPSWAQAALSVFACYRIDDGTGDFPENQRAAWPHGYWVLNMDQRCYAGVHLLAFLPLGVLAVLALCLAPPVGSAVLLWLARNRWRRGVLGRFTGRPAKGQLLEEPDPLQHEPQLRLTLGFLYDRYTQRHWWWESMVLLQTLVLVAAEVFGRTLPVMQQALLLLAVLLAVACLNHTCSPTRLRVLALLEFVAVGVLGLTVTLGLVDKAAEEPYAAAAGAESDGPSGGVFVVLLNLAVVAAYAFFLVRPFVRLGARGSSPRRAGPATLRRREEHHDGHVHGAD